MRLFFYVMLASCLLMSKLPAEIIKTTNIEDIRKEISSDTLVLFNIAEVLIDTETSLGTQAWRKFVRKRVEPKVHDDLTLFVFENVPAKPVEAGAVDLVRKLQVDGISVLAFTSRGRSEWYSSQVDGVDLITEKVLRQAGFDFSLTALSPEFSQLPEKFPAYFHEGIIYTGNTLDKGELLLSMLQETGYHPAKIVLVDDKADSLRSVQKASEELNIPFVGFAYSRTAQDHAHFDPMIANVQLENLIREGQLLSDAEASLLLESQQEDMSADDYLAAVISLWLQAQ